MRLIAIELGIAVGLLLGLLLALELGFRLGRRVYRTDPDAGMNEIGVIQTAMLGVLGLLLAFSFAAAGSRFLERQDLITQEANAIGTSYLRAGLLADPHRTNLRTALKEYTEHRIAASAQRVAAWDPASLAEVERLHERIWESATEGVAGDHELGLLVLPPINDTIDLHATRVGAARKHIPRIVMILLIACSILSMAVIGYGCGLENRRRWPMTISLAIVIGFALCITIDLDYPRAGMLRLSDQPLIDLEFVVK